MNEPQRIIACYDGLESSGMTRWDTAYTEDIFVADNLSKTHITSFCVCHFFGNEAAKHAFRCLKIFTVSEKSDAKFLDFIRLHVVITTTIQVLIMN